TTAVCGSSIGESIGPGRSGSASGRGGRGLTGGKTHNRRVGTRFFDPRSHRSWLGQRVFPEGPTAGKSAPWGLGRGRTDRGLPKHNGEPIRARSRKRRIQTRNAYSRLRGSLLLGRSVIRRSIRSAY